MEARAYGFRRGFVSKIKCARLPALNHSEEFAMKRLTFGQEVADIKEEEALVFKPDASRNSHRVARVQASDWAEAAGAS